MSPDGSCRPAGVVFQPLTSKAFAPFGPGTVMSFPVAGCLMRNASNAVQTVPVRTTIVRVRARRFTASSSVCAERVLQPDDERVSNQHPRKAALLHGDDQRLPPDRPSHVRDNEQE